MPRGGHRTAEPPAPFAHWHVFVNPNIGMTRTGFIRTAAVDIKDGDAIHFRNPANGVTQILCVGVDQRC